MLVLARRSDERLASLAARTACLEVPPRLGEGQHSVGATPDFVRERVVLTVVLPGADRTDGVAAALGQRPIATSRAVVRATRSGKNDRSACHTTSIREARLQEAHNNVGRTD